LLYSARRNLPRGKARVVVVKVVAAVAAADPVVAE
jgi:hypothetical protein